MATIRKRSERDGGNYEVMIRRVGVPYFYMQFSSYDEAVEWVDDNEQLYIKDPSMYDYLKNPVDRREKMREREFKRGYNNKNNKTCMSLGVGND